jgi:type IV pilus assembly protein PilY1
MRINNYILRLAAACVLMTPALGFTQTISDNFVGASSTYSWTPLQGACLTAGSGSGTIPACVCNSSVTTMCLSGSGKYYGNITGAAFAGGYSGGGLPDTAGSGALRLTNGNGYNDEDGGLISNFTFPSSGGLQVTFTTYAYHGDSGGAINDGADGMSFFLIDPSYSSSYVAPSGSGTTGTWTPYDIGAVGGSLGYTCTDETGNYKSTLHPGTSTPQGFDGVRHAYVAVGMDEYGNFQNPGDNTASGPGYLPSSIAVRGPGDVAWTSLNAYNSTWYPSTLSPGNGSIATGTQAQAVYNTCQTGYYWNYSNASRPVQTTTPAPDYNWLAGVSLPSTSLIANENATQRSYTGGSFPPTTTGIYAVPIQYTLTITSLGLMNLTYSYNGGASTSVISNTDITNGGAYPLPPQYAFGFAGSTGGSSNIHEVLCFEAQPTTSSSSSAGLNEKQTSEIQLGTQVYFAFYNPNTWAGSMIANPINVNTTSSGTTVTIGSPIWDASCDLTGTGVPGGGTTASTCATTGAAMAAAQTPTAATTGGRQIITYNTATNAGVPFEWAGASGTTYLSAAQATALSSACTTYTNTACANNATGSSTTIGKDRLNYLRGVRTNETGGTSFPVTPTSGGTVQSYFRARAGVLGDIVDSSPTWVGPPIGTYQASFSDALYSSAAPSYFPENTASTGNLNQYPTWAASVATRTNVVYVGANDGLLHGFAAGSYSNLTTYNSTLNTAGNSGDVNTGQELIAYMPGAVINDGTNVTTVDAIHDSKVTTALDFTSPNYGHNWYIDAPPGTGDLFYGGTWHTWVISGYGPGGQGLFILDGTTPANFSESNAASIVVGEWTSVTLPNCTNPSGACGSNLGDTYGSPQIRRFHNGYWGVIFGNGYGSSSGDAGIYIMLVNPLDATPTTTFYYLSTHTGSATSPNGIGYVAAADLDGDNIADYIYAGDLKGNLWRFDVTSQNPSNWAVSTGGALFTTPGGQPITTKPTIASTPNSSGANRIIVSFGTGQRTPQTITSGATYVSGTQSIYGIWDWNMAKWNTLSTTQYASLASNPAYSYTYGTGSAPAITTSDLQQQVISSAGSATNGAGVATLYAQITDNPVCWDNSTTCSSGNTAMGWYLNLPGTDEQIIYNPVLQLGVFIVNSTIPAVVTPFACTSSNATGFTYAINPTTGGGQTSSFFGDANGNFNNGTGPNGQTAIISGAQLNGTGSVSLITLGGALSSTTGTFLVTQTSGTGPGTGPAVTSTSTPYGYGGLVNPPGNSQTTRLTWKELR